MSSSTMSNDAFDFAKLWWQLETQLPSSSGGASKCDAALLRIEDEELEQKKQARAALLRAQELEKVLEGEQAEETLLRAQELEKLLSLEGEQAKEFAAKREAEAHAKLLGMLDWEAEEEDCADADQGSDEEELELKMNQLRRRMDRLSTAANASMALQAQRDELFRTYAAHCEENLQLVREKERLQWEAKELELKRKFVRVLSQLAGASSSSLPTAPLNLVEKTIIEYRNSHANYDRDADLTVKELFAGWGVVWTTSHFQNWNEPILCLDWPLMSSPKILFFFFFFWFKYYIKCLFLSLINVTDFFCFFCFKNSQKLMGYSNSPPIRSLKNEGNTRDANQEHYCWQSSTNRVVGGRADVVDLEAVVFVWTRRKLVR